MVMRQLTSLGDVLRKTKLESTVSLAALTVLSPQNDPFRLDTPASHEVGRWLRDQMEACGLLNRSTPIHNRGIHYALVARGNVTLPSGKPYINDSDCWAFLERASKAARWLGYIPFEAITDARNAEPVIRIAPPPRKATAFIDVQASLYLPAAEELEPRIELHGLEPRQPYKLVFFGEKTSLGEVLEPEAKAYGADLYLPSGEISDT